MNIALVYDRVNKFGGGERILLALHEIWPKAPLYTAVYNPETAFWARGFTVIPSFLQKFPFARKHHEWYPWLTPLAFESFDFSDYDVVISITSADAKGIITKPETLHICYCLTPTRYLWSSHSSYYKNPALGWFSKPAKILYPMISSQLRRWDQIAAGRPNHLLAISDTVADRIKKYYRRKATIIYPPVDTDLFKPGNNRNEFFLVVSRLVPYKNVLLIINTFNKLKWPLVIVGTGSELSLLKNHAKKNITFHTDLTDEELVGYYQRCQALIHAGIEDFGLTSLEAQACGKPVIAFSKGGFTETVVPGQTGELFYKQTKQSIVSLLRSFNAKRYSIETCRANALHYSTPRFKEKFKQFVYDYIK